LNPRDRFDRPGDSCVPLMRERRDTEGSEGSETPERDTLGKGRFGKPGERTARFQPSLFFLRYLRPLRALRVTLFRVSGT
jgi:hypothetical protein